MTCVPIKAGWLIVESLIKWQYKGCLVTRGEGMMTKACYRVDKVHHTLLNVDVVMLVFIKSEWYQVLVPRVLLGDSNSTRRAMSHSKSAETTEHGRQLSSVLRLTPAAWWQLSWQLDTVLPGQGKAGPRPVTASWTASGLANWHNSVLRDYHEYI